MAYLKPQTPLKLGNDNIYPITTIDQVRGVDGGVANFVTVDSEGLVEGSQLEILGTGSGLVYDRNLRRSQEEINKGISNFNLIDNPFFTINQRNVTTFAGSVYGVDRWIASTTSTCNVVSGGIQISGAGILYQLLELDRVDITKEVTASVKVDGVLYSGSGYFVNNGTFTIIDAPTFKVDLIIDSTRQRFHIISNQTVVVNCAKLEYGHVSTLINDGAPNYADELNKCLVYFERIPGGSFAGTGFFDGGSYVRFSIAYHNKRTLPTFNFSGGFVAKATSDKTITNITATHIGINSSGVGGSVSSAPSGQGCTLAVTSTAYIDISADL